MSYYYINEVWGEESPKKNDKKMTCSDFMNHISSCSDCYKKLEIIFHKQNKVSESSSIIDKFKVLLSSDDAVVYIFLFIFMLFIIDRTKK